MDATTYFDVDGTLLHHDERDDITGAAAAFDLAIDEAAISLYKALVDQYFRRNASDPYCQGIERWVERYGFDVDPEAFAKELNRIQIEDTRAHDGLRDALDRLADRGPSGSSRTARATCSGETSIVTTFRTSSRRR
jgi:FMN phosphatase YigB (HAD superfamily)